MRIAVFNNYRVGLVENDQIFDVTSAVPGVSSVWPPIFMNRLIADWDKCKPALLEARKAATPVKLETVQLHAPNPCPIHIIAAPANYTKHIQEMGNLGVTKKGKTASEQGFFLKSTASLTGPARGIELPRGSNRRFDHESELAVLIGKETRNASRKTAMSSVFGYTCLIDVTMRIEPGVAEEERVMRKSFETFTPMGPWIVTADELADPGNLRNQLFVNDECRQDASTKDLIVDVPGLIELVSSVMTLYPGDVIATGTPQGIGPIATGDTVTISIEKIGAMTVTVRQTENIPPKQWSVA
jgi:2-keto-4-pentenoate hydratase/2-oxohepta-3-ene-1,7-dioic acid hydratase in catechol pathway